MKTFLIILFITATGFISCKKDTPKQDVKEQSDKPETNLSTPQEIESLLKDMQKVKGSWAMGIASSYFYAYYFNGNLKFIDEKMIMGDYGSSNYKYYFKDDYLFYHEQNGKRILTNANKNDTANVKVIMHFNSQGGLAAATKTINLIPVKLQENEAAGIKKHCTQLIAIADSIFNEAIINE